MAYNGFAIDKYLNAAEVTRQLDELIKKPVYSVRPDKLKLYEEEYFEKKCSKSKEMITEAKTVIPGGVQHNLAFNYPFPIVIEKAEGAKLYDIDGNWYYDLLQAGGPTILGSNPPYVREKVIELLNTCGPSTGLFHEYEYKLAKKITEMVPSVQKFRGMHVRGQDRPPEDKEEKHPENGRRLPWLVRPAGLRHPRPRHQGPHVQGRAEFRLQAHQ